MNNISKTDLWEADLPPLADLGGEARVAPEHLTARLQPVLDRVLSAVDQEKRIIVIRAGNTTREASGIQTDPLSHNSELSQFALRGLAHDSRFSEYEVISPDDRLTGDENRARFQELANKVMAADEEGWSEEAVATQILGGKKKWNFSSYARINGAFKSGFKSPSEQICSTI